MKIKNVHIGESIKRLVAERGMSNAAFAKSINIQRQNIDKTVFQKNGVDTDLLSRICEVLDYNFFKLYTEADASGNKKDYKEKEIKGTLTIEFGEQKKDQVFKFVFGENNVEIKSQ